MKGTGLLLLWNDIEPQIDAEYNRWHSMEHVPERVGVPGILAGRRYARVEEGAQRYLSIYELESTAVLSDPAYLSLVDGPTPWSRRMRVHFANVTRIACHRLASAGAGMGAVLATIRIDGRRIDDQKDNAAIDQTLISNTLSACVAIQGIVAIHWCEADSQVPGLEWQATTAPSARFKQMLIAEATDITALHDARIKLETLARHAASGAETLCGPEYGLLHVVHE